MLLNDKNRYFEIIREDIFSDDGMLVYDNYVEEFQPYDVSKSNTKYANFGAVEILKFGVKGANQEQNSKKDKKFQKSYLKAKEYISDDIFESNPILETKISNVLSHSMLSPLLRNLTYGETSLCVWIENEQTYALVNAGKGESACNLLFFCRVEQAMVSSNR